VVGLGADLLGDLARRTLPLPAISIGIAAVTAILWHATGWKRVALRACGRSRPLPPDGWRASAACVAFGVDAARRCAASCWPAMLVIAAAGTMHAIVATLVAILLFAEQSVPRVSRSTWVVPASTAAIAVASATISQDAGAAALIAWMCRIPSS
jgi:predicted metal-binding membrane protein